MIQPGRRRAKERYRAQSEGPHELRPDVGFLPQLVRDGSAAMDAVNRGGAIVGFGGGGTYGSPEHITRLESQLAAAHKEIERLRMRLKQCDERNRATEAKANEQGVLLLRESTRHERFATLIKAAEAENKRLAKRLAQTDRRTADDIRQLELTISSMEEECHSLRIERDTMEEQLMRERDRASQHEFAAKRQTMDHGALVKALSVTKEEKEVETTRRLAVETNLAAARDEIATHLARMHRMDQDIAQLRATLSQTDTTAGTRLTEVVDQLEDERRRHRHAKSTLKSLQENQASADEHWRQKIEALKQEVDSAAASGDWQRSKLLGILLQKQGEAYADRDEIGSGLRQAEREAHGDYHDEIGSGLRQAEREAHSDYHDEIGRGLRQAEREAHSDYHDEIGRGLGQAEREAHGDYHDEIAHGDYRDEIGRGLGQAEREAHSDYHDEIGRGLGQAQAAPKAAADTAAQEKARTEESERKGTPVDLDLEALQVWEDAFKKFDADSSGSIDKTEIRKAMKALGRPITEAEAVAMMEEADADNNGEIDFMEFRKLVAKKSKSKLWYDGATKAAMDAAIKLQQAKATKETKQSSLSRLSNAHTRGKSVAAQGSTKTEVMLISCAIVRRCGCYCAWRLIRQSQPHVVADFHCLLPIFRVDARRHNKPGQKDRCKD